MREVVNEIVKETGVVASKKDAVRRREKKDREGREMVWIRFEKVEKLEVMREKRKLKERKEWITDDLTEKKRRIGWLIRLEANRERRKEKKVRIGYMKLVEGKLWI